MNSLRIFRVEGFGEAAARIEAFNSSQYLIFSIFSFGKRYSLPKDSNCKSVERNLGDESMPTYILLSTLTAEGRKTIKGKPERIKEVNKEIEAFGAKVVSNMQC